jgi:hypothetical protein
MHSGLWPLCPQDRLTILCEPVYRWCAIRRPIAHSLHPATLLQPGVYLSPPCHRKLGPFRLAVKVSISVSGMAKLDQALSALLLFPLYISIQSIIPGDLYQLIRGRNDDGR